jgi:hypothetical protein
MANNSILDFKNGFNGGTRANRFQVSGFWPIGLNKPSDTDLRVKIFASSFPRSEVGTISIPYRGRAYYLPGDRQYPNLAVDVFDDSDDRNIWKAFNRWKELLDGHQTHRVSNNDFAYANLQTTWNIKQLDLNGNDLRKMTLYKCWPSEIGALSMDMGSTEPSVFRVTLTFDYLNITNINSIN